MLTTMCVCVKLCTNQKCMRVYIRKLCNIIARPLCVCKMFLCVNTNVHISECVFFVNCTDYISVFVYLLT